MNEAERKRLVALPVIGLLVTGLAWAGSSGGVRVGDLPLFALCIALAIAIQWLAFVPAYLLQTERFYDLTGSVTYVAVTFVALTAGPPPDARAILLTAMVVVWAVRLGSFLFRRISKEGADTRFDEIKPSFVRFFAAWTLQGVWVLFTAGAALAAISGGRSVPLGAWAFTGLALWLVGLGIEVVADAQKRRFRAEEANRGRFISSGLWAWSRHPNYFGEILLWVGVALVALPTLEGARYVTLLSPVFVILLLTRVSGIPLLERSADERWGGDPDYEAYKARTPILVPRPPRGREGA